MRAEIASRLPVAPEACLAAPARAEDPSSALAQQVRPPVNAGPGRRPAPPLRPGAPFSSPARTNQDQQNAAHTCLSEPDPRGARCVTVAQRLAQVTRQRKPRCRVASQVYAGSHCLKHAAPRVSTWWSAQRAPAGRHRRVSHLCPVPSRDRGIRQWRQLACRWITYSDVIQPL